MSHDEPLIQIVNEADEPIASTTRKEAQQKGLLHRIAEIMVEDPGGRILLQKRADSRDTNPGCWTTSVGGHVDAGEDYLEAAVREMQEEIGLSDVKLQEIGSYRKNSMHEWRKLNRFYKIFKAVVPVDTRFRPDPIEVSEVRWFTLDEIRQLIDQNAGQFTSGLTEVISRFYQ